MWWWSRGGSGGRGGAAPDCAPERGWLQARRFPGWPTRIRWPWTWTFRAESRHAPSRSHSLFRTEPNDSDPEAAGPDSPGPKAARHAPPVSSSAGIGPESEPRSLHSQAAETFCEFQEGWSLGCILYCPGFTVPPKSFLALPTDYQSISGVSFPGNPHFPSPIFTFPALYSAPAQPDAQPTDALRRAAPARRQAEPPPPNTTRPQRAAPQSRTDGPAGRRA